MGRAGGPLDPAWAQQVSQTSRALPEMHGSETGASSGSLPLCPSRGSGAGFGFLVVFLGLGQSRYMVSPGPGSPEGGEDAAWVCLKGTRSPARISRDPRRMERGPKWLAACGSTSQGCWGWHRGALGGSGRWRGVGLWRGLVARVWDGGSQTEALTALDQGQEFHWNLHLCWTQRKGVHILMCVPPDFGIPMQELAGPRWL